MNRDFDFLERRDVRSLPDAGTDAPYAGVSRPMDDPTLDAIAALKNIGLDGVSLDRNRRPSRKDHSREGSGRLVLMRQRIERNWVLALNAD